MPQTLSNILIPTGIMLGIALLLGLLIVLVSRAFAVEKNETKEKILEALPGANCGGCGFAGCEGYADYLSKNGQNTALCAVGGVDCAREIAQILGKEAAIPEKKVAVLRCQGTCEQTSKRYVYLGTSSCHAAAGLLGGPNSCTFGCLDHNRRLSLLCRCENRLRPLQIICVERSDRVAAFVRLVNHFC